MTKQTRKCPRNGRTTKRSFAAGLVLNPHGRLVERIFWVDTSADDPDQWKVCEGTRLEYDDQYDVIKKYGSYIGADYLWHYYELPVWCIGNTPEDSFKEKSKGVYNDGSRQLEADGFFLHEKNALTAAKRAGCGVTSGVLHAVAKWSDRKKREFRYVFCDKEDALDRLEEIWIRQMHDVVFDWLDEEDIPPDIFLSREEAVSYLETLLEHVREE